MTRPAAEVRVGRTAKRVDEIPRQSTSALVWKRSEGHPVPWVALVQSMSGGVLLSHTVTRAVPSALRGLASRFGMELGVSLLL